VQPLALNSLATSPSQAPPVAPQPRLVRAAHEFEAQMMKELLKPMTASDSLTGGDGDSDAGSGGALGEFASEALAQALSEKGGFGIADKIVQELSASGHQRASAQVTGIGTEIPR
jgi:Rod binding domain-containing protein